MQELPIRNTDCALCPFGVNSFKRPKNICLMGEDLQQCDIMVVAEHPTATDDLYGKPFLGRGLKEIRDFFKAQELTVHFTYAVKCAKPDKNEKVKPAYVKACRTAYLQKEIDIVKPKHIIVLGSNAIASVIGRPKKMAEAQGTRFKDEKSGAWIYTSVHFAQANYSEENRLTLWADLRMFTKWIKGGVAEVTKFKPPVYVVDTIKGLRNMARRIANAGGVVSVDTETDGLNPYHPDRNIRTIQFCWNPEFGGVCVPLMVGEGCYYTSSNNVGRFWLKEDLAEAIKIIRKILYNSKIIWHNGKFDRIWLYIWGKRHFGKPILCPHIYLDTMHVAYLLNENRALKLKRLITSELGIPSYDIPDKLTKDLDILFPYATTDTVAAYLLARKYATSLAEEGMEKLRKFYFNVMRRADALYTKMEIRGWPAHEATARKVKQDLDSKLIEVEAKMHRVLRKLGFEAPQVPMLDKHKEPIMMLDEETGKLIPRFETPTFGSYKKLGKLLWEDMGLMPNPDASIAYTDPREKTTLSTKEDALIHIKDHPFVAKLLEWRSIAKALSTYSIPMLYAAEVRGKLTTSYKLAKVVTGRTASGKEEGTGAQGKTAEGMNLQNIPPTFNIKNIVQCPDSEDEWIAEFDFSQVELRIAGELSQDPMLLWAYQNNIDLHTYRAKRTMGLDDEGWDALPAEEQKGGRKKAKPVNFGYLYGMSWYKFRQFALVQYGIDFSADEAKSSRAQFFSDHYGLEKWYGKQERMCLRLGYVETLSGRRRHLPDIYLDPDSSKEAKSKYKDAVRQAINSPVQGFASDLKMMAAIEIDMVLDPAKAKLFGEIHDSILIRVKKTALLEVIEQVLPIMRHPSLLDTLGIQLKVPIEADVEVGPSLGEKKELSKWEEFAAYAA